MIAMRRSYLNVYEQRKGKMGSILLALVNDERRSTVAGGIERLTDHAVDDVPDGERAFAQLCERDYDLAIIDGDQPGLDGFGLCRRLHQQALRKASLPIVFLAVADSSAALRRTGQAAGADDCLVFPMTDEALCKRISVALRARARARGVRAAAGRTPGSAERRSTTEELALALRAERDTLRETFDVFEEALLLMDTSGQVLVANAAGRRLNQAALAAEFQALARDAVAGWSAPNVRTWAARIRSAVGAS